MSLSQSVSTENIPAPSDDPAKSDESLRSRPWKTIGIALVVSAGVFWFRPSLGFTILALLLLITVHEAGHFFVARRAKMDTPEFMVGFGPTLWSKTKGETVYGLKAIPLGGYVRIVGMSQSEEVAPEREKFTYRDKPFRWRAAVSFAGPAANFIFAFVLLTISLMVVGVTTPQTAARVDSVVAGSPAESAGVLPGSLVISVQGTPVGSWEEMTQQIASSTGTLRVEAISPSGEPYVVNVAPRSEEGRRVVGVTRGVETEKYGPLEAIPKAASLTVEITVGAFKALGQAFIGIPSYIAQLFSGNDIPDEQRFLSPLGASDVASSVSERGLLNLIPLAAFINIMLAAFNLLPVPPLDGGHIAIAGIEKVASTVRRRRVRVPEKAVTSIAVFMWGLLILIALSALWLDIFSPVSF